MSLTVVEINYTTNLYEYPNTYQYIPTTGINTRSVTNKYNQYTRFMPTGTMLFTDLIKIANTDYPKSNADLLILLSSPNEYIEFIQNRFNKERIKTGKKYKITNNARVAKRIKDYNLNVLINRLFKLGNPIYLPGHDINRPFTINQYDWTNNQSSAKIIPPNRERTHPEFTKITITVHLQLNQEHPLSVNMDKLKKMNCNQKRKRISRIYAILTNKEPKKYKQERIQHTAPALWKRGGTIKRKTKKQFNRKKRKRRTYRR